jgi:hypothetical protein
MTACTPTSQPPGERTYGMYSFRDVIRPKEEYGYDPGADGPLLIGKVKTWGEIVEYEAGYPSEFGKIVSLDYGDPDTFCISSEKSIGSIMAALLRGELHVVVTDCGDGTWEWEICGHGEPLAARMRDGPFKSEEVAPAAGNVALQEFLELLEFGWENDA